MCSFFIKWILLLHGFLLVGWIFHIFPPLWSGWLLYEHIYTDYIVSLVLRHKDYGIIKETWALYLRLVRQIQKSHAPCVLTIRRMRLVIDLYVSKSLRFIRRIRLCDE